MLNFNTLCTVILYVQSFVYDECALEVVYKKKEKKRVMLQNPH